MSLLSKALGTTIDELSSHGQGQVKDQSHRPVPKRVPSTAPTRFLTESLEGEELNGELEDVKRQLRDARKLQANHKLLIRYLWIKVR